MKQNKITDEQDKLNNHLISLKKASDQRPDYAPLFTAMLNSKGDLMLIVKPGATEYEVKMCANDIYNAYEIIKHSI